MTDLPFSLDLLQFLVDHRTVFLTRFFSFWSGVGEFNGYILVVAAIYVLHDKALAFRLSALVLVTMSINHTLKTLIANPRPFITEGSWAQNWAVSSDYAQAIATEYSTPSGHAMASITFYALLFLRVKHPAVRIAAAVTVLLTGLSRPYLGVHYLEDILLGWLIGALLVLLVVTYGERLTGVWQRRSHSQQVTLIGAVSLAIWAMTVGLSDWSVGTQPLAFISYCGFLTGIVIAYPQETRRIKFEPCSSSPAHKLFRYVITVVLVIGTVTVFDDLFARLSEDTSLLGHLLRYVRYALAGIAAMWVAPLLFMQFGWAETAAGRVAEVPRSP